ncbi:MAG: hypothetical protein AVDCRST_MAG57-1207 [uncultured Blastococcus sp.]|uniref:Uncharacterized protein n=1 Tax=uncultured Blastococcus sp. TaxID=217144 RepID=A0A6J4HVH6_9ACTN|nr:MAG: hypothetical protein AVDCRST_MAG57-1207 [uncultured Blastococcus sp.]
MTTVGVAVLTTSAIGLSSAGAAPAATFQLAPPQVEVSLYPVENAGPLTVANISGGTYTAVDVVYGGAVEIQLPAGFDGSNMIVELGLAPTDSDTDTRTYSTEEVGPDALVVTDLTGGEYRVELPADDTTNGDFGFLRLFDVAHTDPNIFAPYSEYLLEFTGTGVTTVDLAPAVFAFAEIPCTAAPSVCPATPVPAASEIAFTVPVGSLLRTLGIGTLDDSALELQPLDRFGNPTGPVVDLSGAIRLIDSYNIAVTLPAGLAAGLYEVTLVQATAAFGASFSFGGLEIVAPATTVTTVAPVVNTGLRSNTGWGEETVQADAGTSTLVAVGGAMVAVAAAGTVVALRSRRRPVAVTTAD